MSALTPEDREALDIAVDEAETCLCCGDTYGWRHIIATVERIVAEKVAAAKAEAWDEGHKTWWRRGRDECQCGAYYVGECGCGEYGTGELLSLQENPYRIEGQR